MYYISSIYYTLSNPKKQFLLYCYFLIPLEIATKLSSNNNIEYKILTKFPPIERYQSYIKDEILISHCFPNGYTLVQKNSHPVEDYFYFSLDNMLSKDTNDKYLNFCCALFFFVLLVLILYR